MLIKKKGQSILEIIIAVSILVIIATSAVIAMLGSFTTTTLGQQQTQATQLSSQGLAAIESLANQDFNNLVNGTYGLGNNSGNWELLSEPETINSYTRTITIENGPVPESKQVLALVKWKTGLVKENKVELTTVLTNWQVGKRFEPTISSEPVPEIVNSCNAYCLSLGTYISGVCRQNSNRCSQYLEIYEAGGDIYCSGALSSCCCGN